MLTTALRYIAEHPRRAWNALTNDPISIWDTLQDRLVQNREYKRPPYMPDADPRWEEKLAARIPSEPWGIADEFAELWPRVISSVEAQGVPTGPMSFNGYNDGDTAFVRAIWRLARGLRPAHVVETGVAHGFTSRLILEALERNRAGRLWSIDRVPFDPAMRAQVGIAVGQPQPFRWRLIEGTSKRRLPALLSSLGRVDLFIHDSLHTEQNVRFEMNCAWEVLRPGGAMVIDDIDSNWGFEEFLKTHDGYMPLICEAEPIKPDPRRFNGKGLFGIILKDDRA